MEKLREGEGVPHARAAAEPSLGLVESCLVVEVEVETSERDVAHEDQT